MKRYPAKSISLFGSVLTKQPSLFLSSDELVESSTWPQDELLPHDLDIKYGLREIRLDKKEKQLLNTQLDKSDHDYFKSTPVFRLLSTSFEPFYNFYASEQDVEAFPYALDDREDIVWIQKFNPLYFCLIRMLISIFI